MVINWGCHGVWLTNLINMGVSKNRDTPKWLVYNGQSYWNGWFEGTPISENPRISSLVMVWKWVIHLQSMASCFLEKGDLPIWAWLEIRKSGMVDRGTHQLEWLLGCPKLARWNTAWLTFMLLYGIIIWLMIVTLWWIIWLMMVNKSSLSHRICSLSHRMIQHHSPLLALEFIQPSPQNGQPSNCILTTWEVLHLAG